MIPDHSQILPPSIFASTGFPFHEDLLTSFDEEFSDSIVPPTNFILHPENIETIPISTANSSPRYNSIDQAQTFKDDSSLNPNSKRKYFTPEEDHKLTLAAMNYKQGSWNKIAQCVPGRTPKQCRDRWVNYLQPSLKFEPWTEEEDKLLVSLVNTNGTHWSKMKKSFPNRSTNSIKNRWYWLIKNKVAVIPAEKSKYALKNNFSDGQMNNQSNIHDATNNHIFLENNNFNEMKQNYSNQYNSYNPNISVPNTLQINNNQNYYYFVKDKNQNLNSQKKTKKQSNFNEFNKQNDIKKKIFQRNKLQQNYTISDDNDLIKFHEDELNW